jgi:HEAT repeat protein
LEAPRQEDRERVLLELGRLGSHVGDQEAVARTLVELYNLSVWWPEKRALLRAMGECRGSLVVFRFLLRTLDTVDLEADPGAVELVVAILDAFGRLGLPQAGPVLLRRSLGAEVPEPIRLQALEVLGQLGFLEAEEALMAALAGSGESRIVAIYGLTELVSRAGVEEVDAILRAAWERGELEWAYDRELVRACVVYLCTLGAPQAKPWVRRLLYTHEPDLRSLALWGRQIAAQDAKGDVLELLSLALDEDDDYVRALLGRRLRTCDPKEVLEAGEAFGDTEAGLIRFLSVVAEVGGAEVERWLWAQHLRPAGVPAVKAAAIRALRRLDDAGAAALLEQAKRAPIEVAVAAIRAASEFGPVSCLGALLGLLEHDEALIRQEAARGVQHLLLAYRPGYVTRRENKGQAEGHRAEDLPIEGRSLEELDAAFRKILRRDDDGRTQGLVAYAAANLRREELWPRILRLAEKSPDLFARIASYHALLDMPHPDQLERLMAAFNKETSRLARSACIRTLAPLLASASQPDAAHEQELLGSISEAVDEADHVELVVYAHALGMLRVVDPLPVLERIEARGGHRSTLEVIGALGRLRRVGLERVLGRLDAALRDGGPDVLLRAVEALAALQHKEATERLLALLDPSVTRSVREKAARALAQIGRGRQGLLVSAERVDRAIGHVDELLESQREARQRPWSLLQEDLMELKLGLWQASTQSGIDDERVDRIIEHQLGARHAALVAHGDHADDVLRSLRGAEYFHLRASEMPASADMSPAIFSYTKGIELWLDLRLKDALSQLRDMAKEQYQTLMEQWESYEALCRSLVVIPVQDTSRAVDWSKVPRVAKAMKEKKFTADWRTLSLSNSAAIVLFYGVELPKYGACNSLALKGEPMTILSVAVNALALAALRNAMAHEQSATRQDLESCRELAYEVMRGIADWG